MWSRHTAKAEEKDNHCVRGLTLDVPDFTLHSQKAKTTLWQLARVKPSAIYVLGNSLDFIIFGLSHSKRQSSSYLSAIY